MEQLDGIYTTQRLRIWSSTSAAAHRLWATGGYNDRRAFLAQVVPIVQAGQTATVHLLDAYMTQKARQATGDATLAPRGLNPADYTIEKLRGEPADEVYARPFGALGWRLNEGATFDQAAATAGSYLTKLAATDVQLAQTNAARDWIQGANQDASDSGSDTFIVGYARTLDGESCSFCEDAADRLYYTEDLMPIHDHCGCGVEPVYDAGTRLFHTRDLGGGTADSELGARLPTP